MTLPPGAPIQESREVNVWAARLDFTGRDHVTATDAGLVNLADTRFTVRAGLQPWAVGDTLVHEGRTYTVRGIAEIGRRRFLELLARSTT